MVAYNKLAQIIAKNFEKKFKQNPTFKKVYDIYNGYLDQNPHINNVFDNLPEHTRQHILLRAAEGNADLINQGNFASSLRDSIDYEMGNLKRPYNSLTSDDFIKIDKQADELARNNYLIHDDNDYGINYTNNFDSINDAENYFKNELIFNLTGRDRNRLAKEKELSKLNRQQLEDYSTNEYNLPKLENNDVIDFNNDGIYDDYFEEIMKSNDEFKDSLEAEIINQQLKDEFNQRYLQQMEDYDNMLATGGFNEPVKHIDNSNYRVKYRKSKASFFNPNDQRRFNNLFDEIDGQNVYDGFNYDDF